MKVACLFGLVMGAAVFALPHAAMAQDRPAQARVKVQDLDLTSPAGRHTAETRLKASTNAQCDESGSRDIQSQQAAIACRRELLTRGHQKIDQATDATYIQREAEARRLAEVSIHPRRVPRHSVTIYRSQRAVVGHKQGRPRIVRHRVTHRIAHRRVIHRTVVRKATH